MRKRCFLSVSAACAVALTGVNALANEPPAPSPAAVCAAPPATWSEAGSGVLTFAMFDIYEAKLHAPEGRYRADAPFRLTLHYLREFHGKDIAERSMLEMRKQASDDAAVPDRWQAELERIFPNVKPGDELTAHFTPNGSAVFCQGETHLGTLHEPEAARRFADIWLGERTSEPHLRKQLLRIP